MKKAKAIGLSLTIFTLIAVSMHYPLISREGAYTNNKEHSFNETDKLAAQTFHSAFNSMYNITQDPDDKKNVMNNMKDIIGSVLNFVIHVVTQKKTQSVDYHALNQEIQKLLEQYI